MNGYSRGGSRLGAAGAIVAVALSACAASPPPKPVQPLDLCRDPWLQSTKQLGIPVTEGQDADGRKTYTVVDIDYQTALNAKLLSKGEGLFDPATGHLQVLPTDKRYDFTWSAVDAAATSYVSPEYSNQTCTTTNGSDPIPHIRP